MNTATAEAPVSTGTSQLDQLKKLTMERDGLVQEMKKIEEAMPAEEASERLIQAVQKAPDPFHQDNEWTKVGDGPGCCSIM